MGADSGAIPALVFTGAVNPASAANNGSGTLIQQNPLGGFWFKAPDGRLIPGILENQ
jgi:hypothetical protein